MELFSIEMETGDLTEPEYPVCCISICPVCDELFCICPEDEE